MIGFIAPYMYIHTVPVYRHHDTFQFTVTYALGFSIFTSRILATDL
jgi:hypothetical protein